TVTTADASETKAVVISENKIVDGAILPPDEDFLRSIYSDDGTLLFTLDSSGKYAVCDDDSLYDKYEDQRMHEYVKEMLSEEYYEENKEYFEDEVSSYEEYKVMMEEYFGDELNGYLDYEPEETEPLVYFAVELYSFIDEDKTAAYSDEQILIRSAERLVERINEDPEIAKMITNCFENGGDIYAVARVEYDGNDVITISSYFTESLLDSFYGGETEFFLREDISADGRDGIVLAGTFVPADTEKLFLTELDMSPAEIQTKEIVPEDCLKVSCRDVYDKIYDLKYIAENLPELRELYIFVAGVKNTEYIGEMKNLESLSYDAFVMTEDGHYEFASDTPFKELPKLKNLWLYGHNDDYSFLNDMPALESVFVDLKEYTQPYDGIFECPAVTGIEIDISELEKLTKLKDLKNLQHLHLTTIGISLREGGDIIDLSVLGELKELTCLHIRCSGYSPENISSMGELSKLENLELSYISGVEDWSFMQRLTSLKRIDFFEVRHIWDEVKKMTWLDEDNIIF
ncbi:MAG: hypothetical protein J1E40_10070, partial [Oscillospiraceae bacterium]|nr:hypothetical protein [Oscillospiraceae bacterium]